MPTKAVRYTQPLLGNVPGTDALVQVDSDQLSEVLIRQNGVACTVYGSNAKAALANPVPLGVASGTAGVSTLGELLIYFEAGKGYDARVTAGAAVTIVPLPDISPDVEDVQPPIPSGIYPETATVVLKSIVDAKGDLIAGTGPDAVARLAVGADGQVLTASAAAASGLAWAEAAAGGGGEVFYAVDYGTIVAGSTVTADVEANTVAIQAAIAAAKAAGGGVVEPPGDTIFVRRPLVLASNVELRLPPGCTITKRATVKSLLTVNASALATTVTVADATVFSVGDPIHLADTSSYEWLSTQGRITAIAGDDITFVNDEGLGRTGIDGALQTTRAAFASTSFPLIRNEKGSTNVTVRGGTLDQAKNANDPANDFTLSTIQWVETYYSLVEDVTFLNAPGDAYSDQAQDGTGITPALGLIKTTKNTIRGCRLRAAGRHATHLGTCMNGAFVINNEMTNCGDDGVSGVGYALFYCAYVTNTVAMGNIVEGCGQGFAGIDERDLGNVIANNVIKNCRTWAVAAASGAGTGGKCTVTGNVIVGNRGITWAEPNTTLSNNTIELTGGNQGISLGAMADRCNVVGNMFTGGTSGSTDLFLDNCDDVRVIGNIFHNGVKGVSVRGVTRLVAIGNHFSTMTTNQAWNFQVTASTDCVIRDERNMLATPVAEDVAAVRLVYEGVGTNGTTDPAVSGGWFGVTGRRYDGQMVRWNSGGGEKVSIFYNGVGWTALN